MPTLKTQFSELRKHTPKHVQWLLMAAAFIVVLILFTMLWRPGKTNNAVVDEIIPILSMTPDAIDWSKITIGDRVSEKIILSSNLPIRIDSLRWAAEIPGLRPPKTTCINRGYINDKITCSIDIEYAPIDATDTMAATLFIDWRPASAPENMKRSEKLIIAIAVKPVSIPEPIVPEPIAMDIKSEITRMADTNVFEPVIEPLPVVMPEKSVARDCSEFAFPGYNLSGAQIGWIRPDAGLYKFHPYSDKDCNKPTGSYNPDNGIIVDINNPSKKIGTDAQHIGYAAITNGTIPELSNPVATRTLNRARQLTSAELEANADAGIAPGKSARVFSAPVPEKEWTSSGDSVVSTKPYDRTFILRQYKPIPATIVSEIRADSRLLNTDHKLPVIATVDRNVYSDNGRTVIIPTGTTLYGYVTGDVPGPYKTIGRMEVRWYQFVRPDGVEFNFGANAMDPFSADAQGRVGVPGRGSTDYMEQFVMPMLTAIVPAAVNLIAPISDKFVNQIDLNNNTVTQSGQVRSSELAKNEIINSWNKVAQKLMVDMMDNTVPPFSIASGTRITVFSPMDLQVTCGLENGKNCAISEYGNNKRANPGHTITMGQSAENAGSMIGQVRSFELDIYCDTSNGTVKKGQESLIASAGIDYRTVVFYCQSIQYKAINNAKAEAVYNNQVQTSNTNANGDKLAVGTPDYNKNVLGLEYNADGTIKNPFKKLPTETPPVITCEDGTIPDTNGCCVGETFTDMGDAGFNCCPAGGGDCFPPIL